MSNTEIVHDILNRIYTTPCRIDASQVARCETWRTDAPLPPVILCMCIEYLVEEIFDYFQSFKINNPSEFYDDALSNHGFMFDEKKHGEWRMWFYEHNLKRRTTYKGISCGKMAEYSVYANGKRHGDIKTWYENTGDHPGEMVGYFKNGVKHGKYTWWFKNGNLCCEESYVNGVKHGEFKTWYEDGRLRDQTVFVNGKDVTNKPIEL